MVDLRRLRGIAVDRGGRRASVGAGAQAIEIVDALARHGGAVPLGSCPTVGLGGLALGGGYGLAARAWGLTADNVTGIVVVTPDGRLRRVDRAPRRGPVLGAARRRRRQLRRSSRASSCACTGPPAPRGSAARCPSGADAIAAWQAWAPETDPRADLAAAARDGRQRQRARPAPRLRGRARPPARPAAPRRRLAHHRHVGLRRRCRCAGRNGRTTPRTTFSAKSHYVRRALPAARPRRAARRARPRRRTGLDSGHAAPRRLRRRAQPPARPRHGVRAPRRALLDPVPRLPLRRRRAEPRVAAAHAPDRRPARRRRLPELHRPRARRLAARLLRAQPRPPRGGRAPLRPRPPLPLPARRL